MLLNIFAGLLLLVFYWLIAFLVWGVAGEALRATFNLYPSDRHSLAIGIAAFWPVTAPIGLIALIWVIFHWLGRHLRKCFHIIRNWR